MAGAEATEEREVLVENLVIPDAAAPRNRTVGKVVTSLLAGAAVGAAAVAAYARTSKGQIKETAAVGLQQYGAGAYDASGAYGAGAYGAAPAKPEPGYAQGVYDQGAYGQGAYGQGGYGQGAYGQGAYGQGAYGQAAYGQGAYGADAYGGAAAQPAYTDALAGQPAPGDWVAAEQKADQVLATLTMEQKLSLLHGNVDNRRGYAGWVGFKDTVLGANDGPQGYNTYGSHPGTSTQLPCLLAVAASFDPGAATRYATVVAEEFKAKGANVLLGPDVEVLRAPLAGRGFETLSGEDPFLGSKMVAPFVQAVQALGIMACVKHWLDNNSEDYRMSMSVSVDARTQHEIYMPVFKAAFEAGAAAVMCSYNKVAGTHACENKELLTDLLRRELNFRGLVISDWGATHDALRSAQAGLDIDMQTVGDAGGKPLQDEFHKLPDLLSQNAVSQGMIDEKVKHVLSAMYKIPNLLVAGPGAVPTDVSTDAHRAVALQTIVDSAVLLKNDGATLPLQAGGKTIVVVGKYAKSEKDDSFKQGTAYAGGGSGLVESNDEYTITPFEGLKAGIPDCAEVRWSADAGGAAGADIAIVVVAAHSEEGWDRQDLKVPEAQELVAALKGQVQKIVVVAMVPGPVETDWVQQADAAMLLFLPGEQVGVAMAQLLTGVAAPGGRLPVTMPATGESRFTPEQYPGAPFNDENMVTHFTDGVLVGYRWNDATQNPAAFPFGFGLTYTEFKIEGVQATCGGEEATVTMQVTNVGARMGAAVPQVYVSFPSMQPAVRALKGFQKVTLQPGETQTVNIIVTAEAFRYYNEGTGWQTAVGVEQITISVGTSSADLPTQLPLQCA